MARRISPLVWLAFPALFGMSLAVVATRQGTGLSPDSAVYLGAAESVRAGHGLTQLSGAPLTHYPPFYPLALAATAPLDLRAAARWLNVLLFGANVFLVGLAVRSVTRSRAAPLLAATAAAGAKDLVTLHAMAWSEPLGWFLGFSGLLIAARYADRGGGWRLPAAVLLLGFSALTRYAAAVFPVAGMAGLLIVRPARPRAALLAGALALLPLGAWIARNLMAGGSAAGRTPAVHPLAPAEALLLLAWALPMAAVVWSFRSRSRESLLVLLVAFAGLYLGAVALSLSFVDRHTMVDGRILSPVLLATLMALPAAVERPATRRAASRIVLVAAILLTAGIVEDGARWALRHRESGIGYASLSWRGSALMARVRELPGDARLYSNGPDAVYLLAGRRAVDLPRRVDPTSRRPRTAYDGEMSAMAADAGAYVASFDRIRRPYFAGESDLTARVALRVVERTPDGTLYRIAAPGE